MRIFIVDDSTIIQGILTEEFGHMQGVQICGMTGDTRDAVRMILEMEPDLVILDISLQNGSGFDVLRKIRNEGFGCYVIVLTNHPYHHYRQISRELGADLFFDKTFEFEKAIEAVRNMDRKFFRPNSAEREIV